MSTLAAGFGFGSGAERAERDARRARFDAEAVRQLDSLRAFALRLTRVREEAEDLVSDTMLRALQRWEQYRLGTNIRAWLFTILYHAFVSGRRSREHVLTPLEDEAGHPIHEPVGVRDPEGAYFDSFLDEHVVAALHGLPAEYRDAIVMSDLHGLKHLEVAQRLGVPEGTVKSRLFRGRRLLQGRLRDYAEEMGYIRRASASAGPWPGSRSSACRTSDGCASA